MSTTQDEPQTRTERALDGAAGIVGKSIYGTGWCIGRISPKISRAAKTLADTKVGTFVCEHFTEGYLNGSAACLQAEAEAEARRIIASGVEGAKEAAAQFMATVMQLMGDDGKKGPAASG